METVFLLWVTEEDCDGENTYLDDVYRDQDKAHDRVTEVSKNEIVTSTYIEERLLK